MPSAGPVRRCAPARPATVVLHSPQPLISGILNVTPDSLSDGGRFLDHERAVAHGLELVEEGADLIDVGGESTRPGAQPPSVDEELHRVVPVVEKLAGLTDAPLSVDTSRPQVMREAVRVGASMINGVARRMKAAAAAGLSRDLIVVDPMIGALTGRPVEQRLAGSISAAVLAVQRGVHLLRVHDVAATRDALAVLTAVEKPGEG